jgi:probable FeS assembly SUF system protein SufT
MESNELLTLTRDCEAAVVPSGTPVTLNAGEQAQITQSLGSSYTVIVNGNMFRIEGKNGDALGKEVSSNEGESAQTSLVGEELEDRIWEEIKTVYDPEIPVNIVDLGLIYDCHISKGLQGKGSKVEVKMTLTAPGCGMGDYLRSDVDAKIMAIAGVEEVLVDLVWEPQWTQEMMTDAARLELGLL